MSEPLSDEELGGKCSVVNLLHPTGIHFKSPTCEGWFAITAHPTPEKKEHFRQERWESVIHGFDGTLAEHHDDPCYICDHDTLTTQLAEMTMERDLERAGRSGSRLRATAYEEMYREAIDRALTAEQRVKELEDVVDAVRQWGEYTPRRVARALTNLPTDPQEST